MGRHTRPQTTDTSPEAQAILDEIYRRMAPEEKIRQVFGMYQMAQQLAESGFRMHHPHATQDEVHENWIRRTMEPDLATKVIDYRRDYRRRTMEYTPGSDRSAG